ncbi:hypothetical protein SAMN05428988_0162 [Chitinophaga sp. YR573]|uniref:hypothetical protein n=1 Tax=Chitinophaga sp. YR573 TaxID=1881040 RepID=UPI0008B2B655|nr:hypothetical protein [Chitinophaga sp. YR573]SEV88959.1 hypothetical protein SAMN05428988_0162 [Chitinophaga sp. YR573]
MGYPTGQYWMDGKDLYLVYGVTIESGSDDLLKFPKRKSSISHDWQDENGIDVDLSRVYFESRPVTLSCNLIVSTPEEFRIKYNAFIAMLVQPDLRRLELAEFGTSYYVYYSECPSFTRYTRIKIGINAGKVACKFQINLIEKNPTVDASNVFIITDDNRFLIT